MDLTVAPDGQTLLLTFYDHGEQRVGTTRRGGDGAWSEPSWVGDRPSGPYGSAVVGAGGTTHTAWMDPVRHQLRYQAQGSPQEVVVEGLRDDTLGHILADIGESVQIGLASDGQPVVVFQDATRHTLIRARRSANGTWESAPLADAADVGAPYDGAHGFFAGMVRTPTPVAAEFVLDNQADPFSGRVELHPLP